MSDNQQAERWPDPKRWHYDEESGEFFKITGGYRGDVVIVRLPYAARALEAYHARRRNRVPLALSVLGIIAAVALIHWLDAPPIIFAAVLMLLGSFGQLFIAWGKIVRAEREVGPRPRKPTSGPPAIQPRGSTEVRTIE